jgi:hypothetical protein
MSIRSRVMRSAFLELRPQECRDDLARQKGRADILPGVFVDLAAEKPAAIRSLLANDLGALRQLFIAHHQAAAFAGDDVLGLVKAETAEIADRAERPVLVAGHDSLRRVFDDPQVVTPGDGRDRIHFAGDAGVMHRNDRAGPRRDRILDQPFIEIERVLPDIDEHRHRAAQHERVGGRHEGVGGQDDLVAAFDVEQQRRHVQRRRAGVGQQRPGTAGSFLDPLMAALREGPVAGEMVVALRLGRIDHLLAGGMGQVERDVICCHCFTSMLAGAWAPWFESAQIGGFRRGNQRPISAGQ